MIDSVAHLIDDGRLKVYCVDSFDSASWSAATSSLEERARLHGLYEDWMVNQVVPWIHDDCGAALEIMTTGCSFGAYHAANFALKRADLFPSCDLSERRLRRLECGAWGAGRRLLLQQPDGLRGATCRVTTSSGCAGGSALLLVCGQGQWEDTTGALDKHESVRLQARARRISGTSSISGGTTFPTTGLRGETRSPTTCLGSASRKGEEWMTERKHLIGMLLGTEEDWPQAFEALMRRLNPRSTCKGDRPHVRHRTHHHRALRSAGDAHGIPSVIDRLAHWYYVPREWLKKARLMNDVYLMNNPFTFQSMEKHSAYCAMIRLGLKIPETVDDPHQAAAREPSLPLHGEQVQPAVRPRGGRRANRLSAVHEAVRRWSLGRRNAHPRRRRASPPLRRVG